MRQAGATDRAERVEKTGKPAGGGAAGRPLTTLLELAGALSDVLQDEGLASRMLVQMIRAGAVRTARGVPLEISPARVRGPHALGAGGTGGARRDPRGGNA